METATTSQKPRKIYLRGPKGTGAKRILVLLDGTVYEASFTVSGYDDLGGDRCTVLEVTDNLLTVRFGNGDIHVLAPEGALDAAARMVQLELPFSQAA